MRWITARPGLGSCPAVTRIRGALLVAGAICHLNQPEAVAFIEPARLQVGLEGPEIQLLCIFPDSSQKGFSHAAAMPTRIDIEMIEPVLLRDGKTDQSALILGQPDRGGWKDVFLEKRQILLRR